jgi:hypothetical protein
MDDETREAFAQLMTRLDEMHAEMTAEFAALNVRLARLADGLLEVATTMLGHLNDHRRGAA